METPKVLFVLLLLLLVHCKSTRLRSSTPSSQNTPDATQNLSGGKLTSNATERNSHSCSARPYTRKVFYKGCIPKIIKSKYCFGQCNSTHLPGNYGYQDTITWCERCMPNKSHWKIVRLYCPFFTKKKYKRFIVEIIRSCQCNSCMKY